MWRSSHKNSELQGDQKRKISNNGNLLRVDHLRVPAFQGDKKTWWVLNESLG